MIDMTGDHLLTFLIRELKDFVKLNPRFRRAGGEVVATSNGVNFGDVRITISSITNQGVRLSPDYFMYTQKGHTVLGKVPNKEGMFIDWLTEDQYTYDPAIYYLYVDSVDEKTRDVKFLVRVFRWSHGELPSPASGSYVFFRKGVDGRKVVCKDTSVGFIAWEDKVLLTTLPTMESVEWQFEGKDLYPDIDYWCVREVETIISYHTLGGEEIFQLPNGTKEYIISDGSGYELRNGIDFEEIWGDRIKLGPYSPPGQTLTMRYLDKADPTNPVHPENKIAFSGNPVLETCWLKTSEGVFDYRGMTFWRGNFYLKTLLQPGSRFKWDVKVDEGDTEVLASKNATNTNIIPGMTLAIGDMVEVGDEAALITNSDITPTYEVFGSTDNISFTITVTANDRGTVSDISGLLKEHFLVKMRDRHESCGLTIFEMSSSAAVESRDASGMHLTVSREFSVEAASSWYYFQPLITRVADIDMSGVEIGYAYPGNMSPKPYGTSLGQRSWVGEH